nr:MAG TPA: hypothetical protein [Ackermannviridae sp.]
MLVILYRKVITIQYAGNKHKRILLVILYRKVITILNLCIGPNH